ncbi:hypothetical protein KUTeg_023219 [Tegillarca granosa]|uniref:GH16 domain-containing protein n=1 Tax=Tegillarca granosa TaxID=220873 RepID=A0ABQ9E4K9_TEGGR|nr:hypothetical protein KUTeg_023219 [Tegillarca granosa]
MPRRSVKRSHTVFKDDFNSWNPSNYKQDVTAWGGGNGEFQVYTPEAANTFVRNGVLYLKPTFLIDNANFTNYQMYHGRMDLNCNKWSFNFIIAIWMLPRDWSYGGWPRSGEIDLMESRGNSYAGAGGVNHGVNEVSSTLHWGPDSGQNRYYKTHAEKYVLMNSVLTEYLSPETDTYVDNQEILRVNTPSEGFWRWGGFGGTSPWHAHNAPFDKPFQLILNVAVGGAFFPDSWHYNSPKPWHGGQHPMRDFWEKRGDWQNSWHGDDIALQVDYVEMIQQ